jgi:hypothetical protein
MGSGVVPIEPLIAEGTVNDSRVRLYNATERSSNACGGTARITRKVEKLIIEDVVKLGHAEIGADVTWFDAMNGTKCLADFSLPKITPGRTNHILAIARLVSRETVN